MDIIEDSYSVARVQVPKHTLLVFLRHDEQCARSMLETLSKREGVVVCMKNKVRIKRIAGPGWYMISGYREDGLDTKHALSNLIKAHEDASKEV